MWYIISAIIGACFGFMICAILSVGKQADIDSELYYAAEQWRQTCEYLHNKGWQEVTPERILTWTIDFTEN